MKQINAHIATNYKGQIKQRNNLCKIIREIHKYGTIERLKLWKREKPEGEAYYLQVLFAESIRCCWAWATGQEHGGCLDRGCCCGSEKPRSFIISQVLLEQFQWNLRHLTHVGHFPWNHLTNFNVYTTVGC